MLIRVKTLFWWVVVPIAALLLYVKLEIWWTAWRAERQLDQDNN